MSGPIAQVDLRRPYGLVEEEATCLDGDEEEVHDTRCVNGNSTLEEEEIDLEQYEDYLAELKRKAATRPQSARIARHMPTESPQFYMVNANYPTTTTSHYPTRPVSAQPRLNNSNKNVASARPGVGVRRKRHGDAGGVNPRIRAVYHDVGRSTPSVKHMPTASQAATSTIHSKFKVFQQAELHDEYYKLVDVVTELKAICQQEQAKRVQTLARVRRLEEIVTMKDKKIEALLQAKAAGALAGDHNHMGASGTTAALRDRQAHMLVQKLRVKIAQQSLALSSYEEAMQALRNSVKSTNLMELEEERAQLYEELRRQEEMLDWQRLELETHARKSNEFVQMEAVYKQQVVKLQQDHKKAVQEKQKVDQEIVFLKSQVEQLQTKLTLEQRKRTYDREVGNNPHLYPNTSPLRNVMLAQALDEMRALMKKECALSIQREKFKVKKAPICSSVASEVPTTTTQVGSTPPVSSSMHPSVRPQSTGPIRPHRPVPIHNRNAKSVHVDLLPSACVTADHTQEEDFATHNSVIAPIESLSDKRDQDTHVLEVKVNIQSTVAVTSEAANSNYMSHNEESNNAENAINVPESQESNTEANISQSDPVSPTPEELGLDSLNAPASFPNDTRNLKRYSGTLYPDVEVLVHQQQHITTMTIDEEEAQRRKIADVERLLLEVDAELDHGLESDSSHDFLEVAARQLSGNDRHDAVNCEDERDRDECQQMHQELQDCDTSTSSSCSSSPPCVSLESNSSQETMHNNDGDSAWIPTEVTLEMKLSDEVEDGEGKTQILEFDSTNLYESDFIDNDVAQEEELHKK